MNYYIKSTRICFEDGIRPAVIEIENGKFKRILEYETDVTTIDFKDNLCIPGLFDTHTHGYGGYPFTGSSSSEDIVELLKLYAKGGVTSVFASSSITGYASIVGAVKQKTAARILGIHAEGPFLSDKRFGIAAPGTKFLKPSIEVTKELIEKSEGLLKVMTIAPENPGAIEVMQYLKNHGIKVAAGHTDATAEEFKQSISYYDVVTHLGNAMSGIHHREMGVLGAALLSDLPCELIADGLHISKDMLEIMFKLKSLNQFILISDSIPLSGIPVGTYQLDYSKVTVQEDGYLINEFGRLTGSSKTVLSGIKTIYELFHFPLHEIVATASIQPARLYGFDQEIGSIAEGKLADFIIVDDSFEVIETYLGGASVYSNQDDQTKSNPRLSEIITEKGFMNFYK